MHINGTEVPFPKKYQYPPHILAKMLGMAADRAFKAECVRLRLDPKIAISAPIDFIIMASKKPGDK